MRSDEELKKYYKITMVEDDVIAVDWLKELSDSSDDIRRAELMRETIHEIFEKYPDRQFNILADLSLITNVRNPTPAASRKIYLNILKQSKIGRVVVVVSSLVLKIVAVFILNAAGKGDNVKFFSKRREALAWLQK